MFQYNYAAPFVAALVPLILGSIYFNPAVFGKQWSAMTGVPMDNSPEMRKKIPMIMLISYVVSVMAAIVVQGVVLHQSGLMSLLAPDSMNEGAQIGVTLNGAAITDWADRYRTFQHGLLHGAILGVFLAFPMAATMGMYERKPWKLIFINSGYWVLSFALMGGIICAWK